MNKIFTQIALGTALLFANVANAQTANSVKETFSGSTPSCFIIQNTTIESGSAVLPNNTTSTTTDIPVHFQTPYFDFRNLTTATISFSYTFLDRVNGNKNRDFQIGTVDQNGNITYSTVLTVNGGNKTVSLVEVNNSSLSGTFTISFPVSSTIQRIIVTYNGSGGKAKGTFDDLTVNTNYYYPGICNEAPIATDNINYSTSSFTSFTGNFLNDGEEDKDNNLGENISFVDFIKPDVAFGKVVFNGDRTFTFSPATGFAGGPVTFQYIIKDDGYANLFDTANVTITYPEFAILPIHFMSFSGNANGNKAQLAWSVADNETGSHFEVEKSTDGKKYQSVATILTSATVGSEKYDYTDVAFTASGSFYRIKVINKDHSTSYSKTVYIKGATTVDNKLTLMQNPVQSTLNFSFTSATDETAEVAIYNLAGVKMHSQKVAARKGTNSISLGMDSKFNKGAYILTVQSTTASRSVQLIKQ